MKINIEVLCTLASELLVRWLRELNSEGFEIEISHHNPDLIITEYDPVSHGDYVNTLYYIHQTTLELSRKETPDNVFRTHVLNKDIVRSLILRWFTPKTQCEQ